MRQVIPSGLAGLRLLQSTLYRIQLLAGQAKQSRSVNHFGLKRQFYVSTIATTMGVGILFAATPAEVCPAPAASHVVAPITLLPALLTPRARSDKDLKSPCAQVLLGKLEGEGKVFARGRPVVSLATGKASKLSTRARVGAIVEIRGPVASVTAVKSQGFDVELNQGLPSGKGGEVSCEDESSSDQVD